MKAKNSSQQGFVDFVLQATEEADLPEMTGRKINGRTFLAICLPSKCTPFNYGYILGSQDTENFWVAEIAAVRLVHGHRGNYVVFDVEVE